MKKSIAISCIISFITIASQNKITTTLPKKAIIKIIRKLDIDHYDVLQAKVKNPAYALEKLETLFNSYGFLDAHGYIKPFIASHIASYSTAKKSDTDTYWNFKIAVPCKA
ncbi:MAG: hypothetical protein WD068_03690 [Candidatus Babeliales bacterium]